MTAAYTDYRSTYECVDEDPESVPGLNSYNGYNTFLFHVEADCSGLPCPPYDTQKKLTCVVCSR